MYLSNSLYNYCDLAVVVGGGDTFANADVHMLIYQIIFKVLYLLLFCITIELEEKEGRNKKNKIYL